MGVLETGWGQAEFKGPQGTLSRVPSLQTVTQMGVGEGRRERNSHN